MGRIDLALDTIIISYWKYLDSLFVNQAIDIETDISVIENMLRAEGYLDKDFNVKSVSGGAEIPANLTNEET
jgi:hypothetical protein